MERGDERRIRADHRETVRDILARLNASAAPDDMDLPGFRLHRLKGQHAGFDAVTVRANWRVIFRFEAGRKAGHGGVFGRSTNPGGRPVRVYTCSEARQSFASVLEVAQRDGAVRIRRKDGRSFVLQPESFGVSPLDVEGSKASTSA